MHSIQSRCFSTRFNRHSINRFTCFGTNGVGRLTGSNSVAYYARYIDDLYPDNSTREPLTNFGNCLRKFFPKAIPEEPSDLLFQMTLFLPFRHSLMEG